jgi:hypothetical protein
MNDFERIEGVRSDADLARRPDDDPDARVEQLASEIDETRGDLGQTIAEIGDRLDPSTIARDASATVREAALGKVDQMTYGAQETWRDVRTGNTGSIVDTITSNPVPAGMVAAGIALLFMNRGQRAQRRWDREPDRSWSYGDREASWDRGAWERRQGGSNPLDRVGSTVSDAGDRIGQAAGEAGQRVSGALESVGQTAEQLPQQASMVLDQGGGQVRRFIDEYPLGAGVVAFAAGAAIGMLLPTTPLERERIGPVRDQLVDKAEGAVHEALDTAEASPG